MKNVSLVAFYGAKPTPLQNLIERLQDYLSDRKSIARDFIPYQLPQVHATIIGCEGTKTDLGLVNRWFEVRRGETRYMDLAGMVNYLQQEVSFPLTIRFGGYDRATKYNFLSRDRHLYYRSFQLQATPAETIPVSIGWSWSNDGVTLAIDNLRRSFQQFNLLHKYHNDVDAIDNDFYLRLGTIARPLDELERQKIATIIRDFLAKRSPLLLTLDRENLAFAKYRDLSLTPETTTTKFLDEVDLDWLMTLYD